MRFPLGIGRICDRVDDLLSEYMDCREEALTAAVREAATRRGDSAAEDGDFVRLLAAAREWARRRLREGHVAREEQIAAAVFLHRGHVVEMANGEGKTLAAALAASVDALGGRQVHVATHNAYLAKRDLLWMGPLYLAMGVRPAVLLDGGKAVGSLENEGDGDTDDEDEPWARLYLERLPGRGRDYRYVVRSLGSPEGCGALRRADVVYGAIGDFLFRYLLDNRARTPDTICFEDNPFWLILDEADFPLFDKARETHALMGEADRCPSFPQVSRWTAADMARMCRLVADFRPGVDYQPDRGFRVTPKGRARVATAFGVASLFAPRAAGLSLLLRNVVQGLFAEVRDRDYVVAGGDYLLVDAHTGRALKRHYDWGTHEAVLFKEGLPESREREDGELLGAITIQRYVSLYARLSGMTATAWRFRRELETFYGLKTVRIPSHEPRRLTLHEDRVFASRKGKMIGVLDEIAQRHRNRQPVLVDCPDVRTAERLYGLIGGLISEARERLEENESPVPYALDPDTSRDVELDALLGEGVDREDLDDLVDLFASCEETLRPRPLTAKTEAREAEIVARAGEPGAVTLSARLAGRGTDIRVDDPVALEAGGLCVIGFERNESRHVDDQIVGRTARQGRPGECVFFASLDDTLLRIFAGERIRQIWELAGLRGCRVIEYSMVSRAIENAQAKIAEFHFRQRMDVFRKDTILDCQRRFVYAFRRKLLRGGDVWPDLLAFTENVAFRAVTEHLRDGADRHASEARQRYADYLRRFPAFQDVDIEPFRGRTPERALAKVCQHLRLRLEAQRDLVGPEPFDRVAREAVVEALDRMWIAHLREQERIEADVFALSEDAEACIETYEVELNGDYWKRLAELEETVLVHLQDVAPQFAAFDEDCLLFAPPPPSERVDAPPESGPPPAPSAEPPPAEVAWLSFQQKGLRRLTLDCLRAILFPPGRPWRNVLAFVAVAVYVVALWVDSGFWDTAGLRATLRANALGLYFDAFLCGLAAGSGGLLLLGLLPALVAQGRGFWRGQGLEPNGLLRLAGFSIAGAAALHWFGWVRWPSLSLPWLLGPLAVLALGPWAWGLWRRNPVFTSVCALAAASFALLRTIPLLAPVGTAMILFLSGLCVVALNRQLWEAWKLNLAQLNALLLGFWLMGEAAKRLDAAGLAAFVALAGAVMFLRGALVRPSLEFRAYHLERAGARPTLLSLAVPARWAYMLLTLLLSALGLLLYMAAHMSLGVDLSPWALVSPWDVLWPLAAVLGALVVVYLGDLARLVCSHMVIRPVVERLHANDFALREDDVREGERAGVGEGIQPEAAGTEGEVATLTGRYIHALRRVAVYVAVAFSAYWLVNLCVLVVSGVERLTPLGAIGFVVVASSLGDLAVRAARDFVSVVEFQTVRESWVSSPRLHTTRYHRDEMSASLLELHAALVERFRVLRTRDYLLFLRQLLSLSLAAVEGLHAGGRGLRGSLFWGLGAGLQSLAIASVVFGLGGLLLPGIHERRWIFWALLALSAAGLAVWDIVSSRRAARRPGGLSASEAMDAISEVLLGPEPPTKPGQPLPRPADGELLARAQRDILRDRIEGLGERAAPLRPELREALDLAPASPHLSLTQCRVLMEKLLKQLYGDYGLALPEGKRPGIRGLLHPEPLRQKLPEWVRKEMETVQEFGNLGAHDYPEHGNVPLRGLSVLLDVLEWYCDQPAPDPRPEPTGSGESP